MRVFKSLIVVGVIFFALVWMISSYLSVDDLAKCTATPSSQDGCERADAIVAISGGDTSARTAEAIKLYQNGWGKFLIFSGAAADKSGPSNAKVMKAQAVEAGVDSNAILTEEISETTAENALETSSIFRKYNVDSAIIVTSAYHERRALLEFDNRTNGISLRGHPVAEDNQWGPMWWLTPIGWSLALPETIHSLILSSGGVDRI